MDPGSYTAKLTVTIGDTEYTLSKDYRINPSKTELNALISEATTFVDDLGDDDDYNSVKQALQSVLDVAKQIAESDFATKDEVFDAFISLTDALNAAKDTKDVIDKIKELPEASDVISANKDAVEEARAKYDALDDDQKVMVGTTNKAKLSRRSGARHCGTPQGKRCDKR